jgi:hypothetical protein
MTETDFEVGTKHLRAMVRRVRQFRTKAKKHHRHKANLHQARMNGRMLFKADVVQTVKETHANSAKSLARYYKNLVKEGRISVQDCQAHLDRLFVQIECMDFICTDCRPRRRDLVDILNSSDVHLR